MCVLLFVAGRIEGVPLLLGANRDEVSSRAWSPPAWDRSGAIPVLAPRDEVAGGTWIGVNARRLCVVITNRAGQPIDAFARSRGLLVRDALAEPSSGAVRAKLSRWLESHRYNAFNLFVHDGEQGFVHRHGAQSDRTFEIEAGVHDLSNFHDLDPPLLEPVRLEITEAAAQGLEPTRRILHQTLRSHRRFDESGFTICKHHEGHGTLSSTWIELGEAGVSFRFAGGPPCTTPHETIRWEP